MFWGVVGGPWAPLPTLYETLLLYVCKSNPVHGYVAGLPPDLKNSLFSSPSPISSDTQADETVTIMELKNMLTSSMEARDRANVEKTVSFLLDFFWEGGFLVVLFF